MEFMGFLGSALVVSGIGALVILVLAVVQEGKLGGRGVSVRNGFFAAVSLVILAIAVAAGVFVVRLGLASWVFTKAPYGYTTVMPVRGTPPFPPTVSKGVPVGAVPETNANVNSTSLRACTTGCDFTATEVAAVHTWAVEYRSWLAQTPTDTASQSKRRDLVNALSFLLIAAPLFVVFFRTFRAPTPGQPNVVRSVYFYYAAFAGLVMAVVAAALLLNVGLKAVAGVPDATPPSKIVPTPYVPTLDPNALFVADIARCGAVCGFTAEEVGYANRWPSDYAASITGAEPVTSKTQGDLATNIPLLLFGAPLFWYHFVTVRREPKVTTARERRGRSRKKS